MCYYCPDLLDQVTAACWLSLSLYTAEQVRSRGLWEKKMPASLVSHIRGQNQPPLPHVTGDKVSLPGHSPLPPTNPPGYWPPNGVNIYTGHSLGHQCAFSWPTLQDVHRTIHKWTLSTNPFPSPHTVTGVWSSTHMLWDDRTRWNVVYLM